MTEENFTEHYFFSREEIWKRVEPYSELPLVSVGSGMGLLEKYIETEHKKPVICVDPTTGKRDKYTKVTRVRKPDFPNVVELLKMKPELIGNCHLLLIYPLTDYVTYDICAICDLKPVYVTLLYGPASKSGSFSLVRFLRKCGVKNVTSKLKTEISWITNGFIPQSQDFKEVYTCVKDERIHKLNQVLRLLTLKRETPIEKTDSQDFLSPTFMEMNCTDDKELKIKSMLRVFWLENGMKTMSVHEGIAKLFANGMV